MRQAGTRALTGRRAVAGCASSHTLASDEARARRWIALVQDGHVAVMSADGAAAPKRITDEPVLKEWRLSWSPDGTRIVFTRDPGTILVVDPDGSHLAEVPFGKPATGAVWGPAK